MKMRVSQIGHWSLEVMLRTKDLKRRNKHKAGQDHTDRPHLCPSPGMVDSDQAGQTSHMGLRQHSAQHVCLRQDGTCMRSGHSDHPRMRGEGRSLQNDQG